MKTYYKVLLAKNKKLYSAFNTFWDDQELKKHDIRYLVNQWVYPKKNAKQALFVFDNLYEARKWALTLEFYINMKNVRIYECEIDSTCVSSYIREGFPYNYAKEQMNCILGNVPKFCVLTYKVKLTKRIK